VVVVVADGVFERAAAAGIDASSETATTVTNAVRARRESG
jgi:post-segregation antitoxin (ccd killing protein)